MSASTSLTYDSPWHLVALFCRVLTEVESAIILKAEPAHANKPGGCGCIKTSNASQALIKMQ